MNVSRVLLATGLSCVALGCAAAKTETTEGPVGLRVELDAGAAERSAVDLGSVRVSDDDTQPLPPTRELGFLAQQVFDGIATHHNALVSCYRDLFPSVHAEGSSHLRILIASSGAVENLSVDAPTNPALAPLSTCIQREVTSVRFVNMPPGGASVDLVFDFEYAANATVWSLDPIRIGRAQASAPVEQPAVPTPTPHRPRARRPARGISRPPSIAALTGPDPVANPQPAQTQTVAGLLRAGLVARQSALDACVPRGNSEGRSLDGLDVLFAVDPTGQTVLVNTPSESAAPPELWSCVSRTLLSVRFTGLPASAQRARVTFQLAP